MRWKWVFGLILSALILPLAPQASAQAPQRHAVLVTIDGLRWQEVFRGADPALVSDSAVRARYVDVADRGGALTPFLRSFSEAGALIGNRDAGSCARVANEFWFSYPGYAELLSGRVNPAIRSNEARPNPDATVLELLARRPDFASEVRVFAEWDAVPAIVNVERSGIPVYTPVDPGSPHDPQVIQAVRALYGAWPRVVWIALGDTDNHAHAGDYAAYLDAAAAADAFIGELWAMLQSDPATAGATTLIVTSDHGRGDSADNAWRGHGSGRWRGMTVPGLRREGSDAIFMAVRGPGVSAADYPPQACATASQIAGTLLASLGFWPATTQRDMAAPLAVFGASGS